MARLGPVWAPFPKIDYKAKDIMAVIKKQEQALANLRKSHRVLRFPVADGYAFYVVEKETPLTLRWVPYLDEWTVPGAMIRGLRLQDVREMAEREEAMNELFGRQAH